MKIKILDKPQSVYCDSLEDAYNQGYFSSGISRENLIKAIKKCNSDIWINTNETHAGVLCRSRFICGISKLTRIPEFTIYEKSTNKVLCRSWKKIVDVIEQHGYKVDRKILTQ